MDPIEQSKENDERRTSPRVTTKIEIKFGDTGALIKSYMLNVSNGGIYIKTDKPFSLDTLILLKFSLPDDPDPIEIEGKVVWSNPRGGKGYFPKGMGIKFLKIKPADSEKIKKFVEQYKSQIESHAII